MPLDWTQVIEDARRKTDEGGVYKRKWRSVLDTAGGRQSSYEQRVEFARLLVDNDLAIAPHIDGASPKKDDYVTIIDASHLPPREQLRFKNERPLEDLIEAVMPNFPGLEGVKLVGRQVHLGRKRLDLLGSKKVGKGRTRWYVIEVERQNVKESVAQVTEYGKAFRKHGAKSATIGKGESVGAVTPHPDDEITLVVIAQQGDEDLAAQLSFAAAQSGFHAKWIAMTITAELIEPGANDA